MVGVDECGIPSLGFNVVSAGQRNSRDAAICVHRGKCTVGDNSHSSLAANPRFLRKHEAGYILHELLFSGEIQFLCAFV